MSILGRIVSSIFGHADAAPAPGTTAAAGTTAAPGTSATPGTSAKAGASTAAAPAAKPGAPAPGASTAAAPAAKPGTTVDVTSILDKLAASNNEKLDWRHSIVDLMKLLNLDSSLATRKTLADELHYSGDKNDSGSMNIWLHKQVMTKLAENGGKVPDELRK